MFSPTLLAHGKLWPHHSGNVSSSNLNSPNVFIDASVIDFPVVENPDDGVFQLITHGKPGQLFIKGKWLAPEAIALFVKSSVGDAHQIKQLNIYGCEFGKGQKGREAIRYLEERLKMRVAASNNITGKGGDWKLEVGKPRSVLKCNYAYNLQASCYTPGASNSSINVVYYKNGGTFGSESSSVFAAPNFSSTDANGYPTYPAAGTAPYSGSSVALSGPFKYAMPDLVATTEIARINFYISKKAMDCSLGFSGGYYEFRFRVAGFQRAKYTVDTNGSTASFADDWKCADVEVLIPAQNASYSDSLRVQLTNPTAWLYVNGYIIDNSQAAQLTIEYRHSSQSTFSPLPSSWAYASKSSNEICIKDEVPTGALASPATICAGASSTLSANCTLSGATLNFYSNATLTTALASNVVTPAITTTYYAACSKSGCTSNGVPITVTVNPLPAAPVSGGNKSYCAASALTALTATTAAGTAVDWYSAATGGTALLSNNTSYTPTAAGTYYAEARNTTTGCVSASRTVVTLTANPNPAAPASGGNKSYCTGGTIPALTATVAAGQTVDWYTTATGGSLLSGNSTSYTPTTAGTYYAEAKNTTTGCLSTSRTAISLTANSLPAAPTLTSGTTNNVCPSNKASLTALITPVVGMTYEWHTANNTNAATLVASPASVDVGTYYAFAINSNGCYSSASSQAVVTINSCAATNDTSIVTPACPTCTITACVVANEISPVGATYSSCGAPPGYTAGPISSSGCITYTPTGSASATVPARTCIVACNGGICDTTIVFINPPITKDTAIVACNNGKCDTTVILIQPPITKDTANVTPACPACTVTACVVADDINPSGATYTSCGAPDGYTASPISPSGCITYTPTGTASTNAPAQSCIVACNNGKCDTTIVLIQPAITPDSVTVTPTCSTCTVTACVVADDINPADATYTSCGNPVGYTENAISPSGCITYTPTGSASTTTPAQSCIVACNNGLCDTTYVFITAVSIPTPVKIVDFTGQARGNATNLLTWIATDINHIESYSVLRSQDQQSWKEIGAVPAINETGKQVIHLTDSTPDAENFYRLSIKEQGASTATIYQKTVYVKRTGTATDKVNVYPNPTHSIINLEYNSSLNNAPLKIVVMDIAGRNIKTVDKTLRLGKNTIVLDVSDLTDGTYLIQYNNSENGNNGKVKFMKQKN
jgi:hypothetical protein